MSFLLILVLVAVVVIIITGIMVNENAQAVRAVRPRTSKEEIGGLDFSKIHEQLKVRKGWSDAQIAAADAEYRKFLWLLAAYPGEMMVPWNVDMDDFWHQHILNTVDYTATCQKLFGKYINHTPEDTGNASAQHRAARKTNERYTREFDKRQPRAATTQGSGCSSTVYAACSSVQFDSHHSDGFSDGGHDGGGGGGDSCSSGCGGGCGGD